MGRCALAARWWSDMGHCRAIRRWWIGRRAVAFDHFIMVLV
jgi:hypothetical protein